MSTTVNKRPNPAGKGAASPTGANDAAAPSEPAPAVEPRLDLRAKSKASVRRELEREIDQFLHKGGEVKTVPMGTSAWEPGTRPPPSGPLFAQPRGERTPVNEVVATIEARREAMKTSRKPAPKRRSTRRKRRLIYDDFGEPLRHVWVEE